MPATAEHVREPWTIAGNLDAQVRETHTGVVVLLGDKAYKAKKPVTTDFLDFSTPARREHACQREVALNSRLSPNSYLGVAHFTGPQRRSGRTSDRDASLRGRHSPGIAGQDRPACPRRICERSPRPWRGSTLNATRGPAIDAHGDGWCDRRAVAAEPGRTADAMRTP